MPTATSGTGAATQAKIVLVVDDDPDIRELVCWALTDEGYSVVEARNGQEALDAVQQAAPDAILLDLGMPVMDGWTFVREYRTGQVCDGVPIVIMSAGHRAGEATQLGASAFVTKPFDLTTLLGTLAALC